MSSSPFNLTPEVTSEKTIVAARMGIGIIISFVLTNYYTIVDPTWIYITFFVISFEQRTIGASLMRSSMRAIATISSAVYSLIIILLFNNYYLMNLFGLVVGVFIYTYLFSGTSKGYIGTLGSVTLAICLINHNDISQVFIRTTNVLIGIAIGTFVVRFFFPIKSIKMLILELDGFLSEYASFASYLANVDQARPDMNEYLAQFEAKMMPAISRFQTLINEAKVEMNQDLKFTQDAEDILKSLRRIFRYYTSFDASILFEGANVGVEDRNILLALAQVSRYLQESLAQLKPQRIFIRPADLKSKDEKNVSPLMLHLISSEFRALEVKINKLLITIKTVKLE